MDSAARKILGDLKAKRYKPVYLLQGEETYYIDLIADFIEEAVLTEAEKGFNQVVVYGRDVTVSAVLTHARRFPMMSAYQVVVVREAQEISDLQKETGARLLIEYLKNPLPSTLLVLCHKHKTLDKRKELGKVAEKLAESATFKKPYENQLASFVESYLADRDLSIQASAVATLCNYVGNDLNRLANEIDKLRVSLQPGQEITNERVIEQVGISREYNIFELQKAVVNRNMEAAARMVRYFESNPKKNPAIPMVAYLFSFFSKALVASRASDKSKEGLVNLLKINPYSAGDYSIACRNFSSQQLERIVRLCAAADRQSKGMEGDTSDGQIMKSLVAGILLAP